MTFHSESNRSLEKSKSQRCFFNVSIVFAFRANRFRSVCALIAFYLWHLARLFDVWWMGKGNSAFHLKLSIPVPMMQFKKKRKNKCSRNRIPRHRLNSIGYHKWLIGQLRWKFIGIKCNLFVYIWTNSIDFVSFSFCLPIFLFSYFTFTVHQELIYYPLINWNLNAMNIEDMKYVWR